MISVPAPIGVSRDAATGHGRHDRGQSLARGMQRDLDHDGRTYVIGAPCKVNNRDIFPVQPP
jgi:hypothetical protein